MGDAPARPSNPYVGPRSIRYGEPIYGRDRELDDLQDTLISQRLVLLYSPSGAGKSSLLEAGLRPRLEDRGFVVLPTIRVGYVDDVDDASNRYVRSVITCLEATPTPDRSAVDASRPGDDLVTYVTTLMEDVIEAGSDVCLFFDQFEEVFTLDPTDQPAKEAFLTQLGVLLRDRRIWALFAMREDFIAQLDPYLSLIPTRWSTRWRLDLLDVASAKDAARNPALRAGVDFAPAAAERLIDDLRRVRVRRGGDVSLELGPYVEPVQLQVVCHRLWNRMVS